MQKQAIMQKGVSLYLAFILMTLLLAISLGVAGILVAQLKITRGMADSVIAFYAAETGVEEILYAIRKNGYEPIEGEEPCGVAFECLALDNKFYKIEIRNKEAGVLPIASKGSYKQTNRAIEITLSVGGTDAPPPEPLERIVLKGRISLQGREGIQDFNPTFLEIRVRPNGRENRIFRDVVRAVEQNDVYFFETELVGIEPGNYDISVKEWHYLSILQENIALSYGDNDLGDLGTAIAGDTDNDDIIDREDLVLVFVIKSSPDTMNVEPTEFRPPSFPIISWHADIDNNGRVDNKGVDEDLLRKNYRQYGPSAVRFFIKMPFYVHWAKISSLGPHLYRFSVWQEGQTRKISWDTYGQDVSKIKLQYSLDNPYSVAKYPEHGLNYFRLSDDYTDIELDIPNTGEYMWGIDESIVSKTVDIKIGALENSFYYDSTVLKRDDGFDSKWADMTRTDTYMVSVLSQREIPDYPTGENVLVIYNNFQSENPNFASKQEGLEIAEYYASKRQGAHLLGIDIPDSIRLEKYGEVVVRDDYEEYIRDPIKQWLDTDGLGKDIRYIVLTKGMPLKIKGTGGQKFDRTSVDSELVTLHADYEGLYNSRISNNNQGVSLLSNPYYYYAFETNKFTTDNGKLKYLFQPDFFGSPLITKISYLVTRLDGYSVQDVKDMIDRSVNAQTGDYYWVLDDGWKNAGLNTDRIGLFKEDDDKTRVINDKTANIVLEELGLNIHSDSETSADFIQNPISDPIIGYVGTGVYSGYGNDYITDKFKFNLANGALFSSYESFNGFGFHDKGQSTHGQLGEWIAIGGTGGAGNVYEPYASAIANEAIWMPAYAQGYPLADAFYMSLPYLSWVSVIIGDPLANIK